MLSTWRETNHLKVSDAQTPVIGLEFSANARYLAIAYGTRVDIWDLKDTISTSPLVRYENDSQISSIAWSASSIPQLAICFEGGLIYVVTLKEQSSLIVGFQHSAGCQQAKVSAVFFSEDLLAVAMGKAVEIRRYHTIDGEFLSSQCTGLHCSLTPPQEHPAWIVLANLPAPPVVKESGKDAVSNIHSIHAIAEDCILLSYENGLAVTDQDEVTELNSLWNFLQSDSNPMTVIFQHKDTTLLPGVIGAVLVTASGTYQVFLLRSSVAQHIFIPRNPISKAPQAVSCVGQLVLWNAELGNRLQNLLFRSQGKTLFSFSSFDVYISFIQHLMQELQLSAGFVSEKDSARIVTAQGSEITFWEMTDVSSDEESKIDQDCAHAS
ncbi:hypothetical protein F5879DRAFT_1066212 [Lentinula edodes]|nr:hypothetical protein F5879DRAFT_1066212 [Lentinula edodes]